MAAFFAGSVTATKCQPCEFEALGACCAIVMHSSITSRSTGRLRSSLRLTARVVVSTSSGVRSSTVPSTDAILYSLRGLSNGPVAALQDRRVHEHPAIAARYLHGLAHVDDVPFRHSGGVRNPAAGFLCPSSSCCTPDIGSEALWSYERRGALLSARNGFLVYHLLGCRASSSPAIGDHAENACRPDVENLAFAAIPTLGFLLTGHAALAHSGRLGAAVRG